MNILSFIFNGIFWVLFVCIISVLFISFFPRQTGLMIKIVKSGSMEPNIHTGSVVVIRPSATYRVGDVITFGEDTREAIPTTHRIVDIRKASGTEYYKTKGDANEEADGEETSYKNVIGRVLFTIPYAGFILDFAKQPIGFFFLVVIPAGVIIIDETRKIVQEVKKRTYRI